MICLVQMNTVSNEPHDVSMSAKEFNLLTTLGRRKGKILSKTEIAELVWDMNFDSHTNVVEVAIKRLREARLAQADEAGVQRLVADMRATAGGAMPCTGPLVGPDPAPDARAAFNDYVRRRWPVRVFALDPAVDEQTVDDAFARRRELQIATAAAFASGTGTGTGTQRLRTVGSRRAGRCETRRNIAPAGGSSRILRSEFAVAAFMSSAGWITATR